MARSRADGTQDSTPPMADGGLLRRTVRRDLVDLNLAYLELGLALVDEDDPLVAWTPEVRREIAAADPGVRARMAECPFSLFKISLSRASGRDLEGRRVEDAVSSAPPGGRTPRCVEFRSTALFAAWRLADSAPLAARIVFGLTPSEELLLNELSPSRVHALAMDPAVVRARWPDRPRFWAALRDAADSATPAALQWVHCMGICLTGGEPVGPRGDDPDPAPGRRRR